MANRWQQQEVCDVSALAKPLEFNFSRRIAKNRFMKSAMAESLASWSADQPEYIGVPTEQYVNVYKWYEFPCTIWSTNKLIFALQVRRR